MKASQITEALRDQAVPPPLVVEMPEEGWASRSPDRPFGGAQIGILLLADEDTSNAVAEARKKVRDRFKDLRESSDQWVEEYNSAFMREIVGRCICNPGDSRLPFHKLQEDVAGVIFSSVGIEILYEEYAALVATKSVTRQPLTEEQRAWLADQIRDGSIFSEVIVDDTGLSQEEGDKARRRLAAAQRVSAYLSHLYEYVQGALPLFDPEIQG